MVQDYKQIVDEGVEVLIQSFGLVTDELFKKSLVVSHESNPFGDLPEHIKMAILQNAFHKSLAQSMASVALLGRETVTEKEVFSAGTMVLRKHYDDYLKFFKEAYARNKKAMGQGSQARNEAGVVLTDGDRPQTS